MLTTTGKWTMLDWHNLKIFIKMFKLILFQKYVMQQAIDRIIIIVYNRWFSYILWCDVLLYVMFT